MKLTVNLINSYLRNSICPDELVLSHMCRWLLNRLEENKILIVKEIMLGSEVSCGICVKEDRDCFSCLENAKVYDIYNSKLKEAKKLRKLKRKQFHESKQGNK